jgi:hypothetical protein
MWGGGNAGQDGRFGQEGMTKVAGLRQGGGIKQRKRLPNPVDHVYSIRALLALKDERKLSLRHSRLSRPP